MTCKRVIEYLRMGSPEGETPPPLVKSQFTFLKLLKE